MKAALRVLLVGAAGRMGKTIVDLARRNPNIPPMIAVTRLTSMLLRNAVATDGVVSAP